MIFAAVVGDGFITQDITFRNTAGATNHQAVAIAITHTDKQATPQMTKINNTEHAWMKQKHV